jgi:hypothetical protein
MNPVEKKLNTNVSPLASIFTVNYFIFRNPTAIRVIAHYMKKSWQGGFFLEKTK